MSTNRITSIIILSYFFTSECRLCGDRDETINHIISECSKLAQKEYKTRHDWGEQGDPLGDVQEIEPYEQMVYAQPSACPRK